jgi:hypothetical protein
MPGNPLPGAVSCARADPMRSTSRLAWWTSLRSPGRISMARTHRRAVRPGVKMQFQ